MITHYNVRRSLAHPDDKPAIGPLLCRTKHNITAEYALHSSTMPIGIAEWTTAITTHLPDELTATLTRNWLLVGGN